MSRKFFSLSTYDYIRNTCLHQIDERELVTYLSVLQLLHDESHLSHSSIHCLRVFYYSSSLRYFAQACPLLQEGLGHFAVVTAAVTLLLLSLLLLLVTLLLLLLLFLTPPLLLVARLCWRRCRGQVSGINIPSTKASSGTVAIILPCY